MQKKVLVTGDFVLDHHIYEGGRHHYGERVDGVREIDQFGGATLIHSLLSELLQKMPYLAVDLSADIQTDQDDRLTDDVPASSQAYAFWRPTLRSSSSTDLVWRSSEAMGFGGEARQARDPEWPPLHPSVDPVEVVVISDGGAGFRDDPSRWPTSALEACRWIVLKTTAPFMEGALWEALTRPELARKLVVTTSASQVRKSPARLGAGLSWEDTLETLAEELQPGGALEDLLAGTHLIISFESEGAVWFEREATAVGANEATAHLIYRPGRIEGEQMAETKGSVFGLLSCLTAAVTWRLLIPSDEMAPDLEAGLESGLAAMHDLADRGHGPASRSADGFPAARLAGVMQEITCRYARAILPMRDIGTNRAVAPVSAPAFSLFRESLRTSGYGPGQPAYDLAGLVVRHGMIALESLPHLHVGALISIDREEIESLRMLTGLMTAYRDRPGADKPLSIGVFGPPGSGKSFTVKQLARAVVGKSGWLEFNLSQFAGPQDLIGAFHQVRDAVLEGDLPVAFFDEFDSRHYTWLQYLLAPMQDGRFQEGQITHPVGKCIFIFAGATSHSFETFGPSSDEQEAWDHFRFAKGPDFKSRLDGFLNVAGPNPQSPPLTSKTNGERDVFFPVRRAFLIRGLLGCKPWEGLNIHEGLLNALLTVHEYKHGSRSLSKVVEPLKTAAPGPLYRSLVPPRGRLALHTDAEAFLDLCAKPDRESAPRDVLSEEQIDVMATAIHQTWSGLVTKAGEDRPDARRVLAELSDFRRDSNRAAAHRMVKTLDMVNLTLEPGSFDNPGDREWVRRKLEYHLELLAEAEHKGWMQWHIDQDWVYGRKRNDEEKIHNCLLPYARLSEHQKNKDRNAIRHYIQFAEVAGMRIVPALELSPGHFP